MRAASVSSWAVSLLLAAQPIAAQTPVSSAVFANLLRYQAYAAATYADFCAVPPFGSTVVQYFNDANTDTQATLFRNAAAKEIVMSFRGTSTPTQLDTDLNFALVPLTATGTSCSTCQVHDGFQSSYAAISAAVISAVKSQVAAHHGYSLVITGHSLGAGIGAIAASSLAGLGYKFIVYTYGEPRNGNPAFTSYINGQIPVANYYRVTHANDGVPQIPPTLLGYQHHGTEYWESASLNNTPATTYQCPGIEPQECNASTNFGTDPIDAAHLYYSNGLIGNSLHIAACGAMPVVMVQ